MSSPHRFRLQDALIGAQMLFVAFGALVLVPILTGLDANVALFTAGIGTLVFQLVTKGRVPVFLASSFAFIAPIIYAVETWGIPATLSGLLAAGVLYIILSLLVAWRGAGFIHYLLPPVVVGPVIMVIGLGLAPVAVNLALGKSGDGSAQLVDANHALMISMTALIVTVVVALLAKGLVRLIPILLGIIAGYSLAYFLGVVDLSQFDSAPLYQVPQFVYPEWNWQAVFFILPIAIAPTIEHVGDMLAISSVTNEDYLENPGLHRTLLGDGLATSLAAFLGGPPNTTYSEVTGAVTITRCFNPFIMVWAALFAIALSFSGKLGTVLQSIPTPVMGGIMTLLFGSIAVIGLNTLVRNKVDLIVPRNLTIVALVLVFGVGGMHFGVGQFSLQGIGLAAIIAILLNLILPKEKAVE